MPIVAQLYIFEPLISVRGDTDSDEGTSVYPEGTREALLIHDCPASSHVAITERMSRLELSVQLLKTEILCDSWALA